MNNKIIKEAVKYLGEPMFGGAPHPKDLTVLA